MTQTENAPTLPSGFGWEIDSYFTPTGSIRPTSKDATKFYKFQKAIYKQSVGRHNLFELIGESGIILMAWCVIVKR